MVNSGLLEPVHTCMKIHHLNLTAVTRYGVGHSSMKDQEIDPSISNVCGSIHVYMQACKSALLQFSSL